MENQWPPLIREGHKDHFRGNDAYCLEVAVRLNEQPGEGQQHSNKIEQRGSDRAIQIGQVFGKVVFQLLSTRAVIATLAALAIAAGVSLYLYRTTQRPTRITPWPIGLMGQGSLPTNGAPSGVPWSQSSQH